MLHRIILALPLVLALAACDKGGGATTKRHDYDKSVKFSITIPSEFKEVPEDDADGGWKFITFVSPGDHASFVIISWQPTWDYDTTVAWFKDIAAQHEGKILHEEDLPDARGFYRHYDATASAEGAKAVVRCGSIALECTATVLPDDPDQLKKDVIAACKTLVCK